MFAKKRQPLELRKAAVSDTDIAMFRNFLSSFQKPTYNHSEAKIAVKLSRNRIKIQVLFLLPFLICVTHVQREKKASMQDLMRKEIAEVLYSLFEFLDVHVVHSLVVEQWKGSIRWYKS